MHTVLRNHHMSVCRLDTQNTNYHKKRERTAEVLSWGCSCVAVCGSDRLHTLMTGGREAVYILCRSCFCSNGRRLDLSSMVLHDAAQSGRVNYKREGKRVAKDAVV